MKQNLLLLISLLSFHVLSAQITLTHNVGTTPIATDMTSCEDDESWSRIFKLSDFGIKPNEQFIINSGQVALSKSHSGARIFLSVFSIHGNFPAYYSNENPIRILGSASFGQSPDITDAPQILDANFNQPIVVPAGVERILVTVWKQEDFYNPESAEVLIAGTAEDTGISWYEGCRTYYNYTPTTAMEPPVPNANFYINVSGGALDTKSTGSTTRLTHNTCDDIIETNIHSCTFAYIYWARDFYLEDFGISSNETFTISSGQVGINKTGWLPEISFNIYAIDDNFPNSFSQDDLLGSSQYQQISPSISRNSEIIQVDFETPITVPAGTKRILVEVHKGRVYGDAVAFIAGSTEDTGVSWQRGCIPLSGGPYNEYVSTDFFGKPDANFYINVTGNVSHLTNRFNMEVSNICSEFFKEFSIENKANIASIQWNFGDPTSGSDNVSTDLSPFHDFSEDGIYTVTAIVTSNDGRTETLSETIDVKEPPQAYGIDNVYACETIANSGISSSIDLSHVEAQVLGNQTEKVVTYITGNGQSLEAFPTIYTNTVAHRETITVRVAHQDEPCCYSETTFDLIIHPKPAAENVEDIVVCETETSGFATFDLLEIKNRIIGNSSTIDVEFFRENGQQINEPLTAVQNTTPNEEMISIHAISTDTGCYSESSFKLIVSPSPEANSLSSLIGCDDNNDGISDYFDTSAIEAIVLAGQTGMEVSYFTADGTMLPSPLPNPYTNQTAFEDTLTVRVTNPDSGCFAETEVVLTTSSKPAINNPADLFACDTGNGFGFFDTTHLESELIGNQSGLNIIYYDSSGNELPSPLPASFKNTEAWNQTIQIKVENALSDLCVSETTVNLIVEELPMVELEPSYFICNLDPFISINVPTGFDLYQWQFQDGTLISTTHEANLVDAGNYALRIERLSNGVICEETFEFELIRSILPSITEVKTHDQSSNNSIEIMASGDGDFQYSIDGIQYQASNYFDNLKGGVYTVFVRDAYGCGEDTAEVTLIDYPDYFTPNNDGFNDYWQIEGIEAMTNSNIRIYDRYGKLLKQLSPNGLGWDGTFNGALLESNDYWFTVELETGKSFSGHFALKR